MSWVISGGYPYIQGVPALTDVMSEPYPYSFYRQIHGDYPFVEGVPELRPFFSAPYPYSMFLIDGVTNDGYPFLKNIGCPSPPIDYCSPVKQHDYITVYDMSASQNEFETSNGIAILTPSFCHATEEAQGMYELELTHPIDEQGKWRTLLEENVIKAGGQLFRIYHKATRMNEDGTRERTVNAKHIFYDLADKLLLDVRPTDKTGQEFLDWIFENMFEDDPGHIYDFYNFTWSSDITDKATAYYQKISPVAALIGEDNCFVNRLGGELYRDNFYFSINQRREGARDNAFSIRYGADMLEVEETIDYTELATFLRTYNNFGGMWGSVNIGGQRLHHNRCKAIDLSYDSAENYRNEDFLQDSQNLFDSAKYPKFSYTVKFANLKNDERYKDFLDLQHCNVGDMGTVYCEELDIITQQKIVKKVTDMLTGDVVSIELGNMRSTITKKDFMADTISKNSAANKENSAIAEDIRNSKLKRLGTHRNLEEFTHAELSEFTHKELEGIIIPDSRAETLSKLGSHKNISKFTHEELADFTHKEMEESQ